MALGATRRLWPSLEQLYRVTIQVLCKDLSATGAADNLVSKLDSGSSSSFDLGIQVVDFDEDAVPTARLSLTSVGHRAASRGPGAAEQERQVSLNGPEQRQWRSYVTGEMREWENSFYQYEQGLFTDGELQAHRQRWTFQMTEQAPEGEAYRTHWQPGARNVFAPSFRAKIDAIVAEVGG